MIKADKPSETARVGRLRRPSSQQSSDEGQLRVAYCLGTRPEVIRSARLLRLLRDDPAVVLAIVNSGQHYDANMFADFMLELAVPRSNYDLNATASDPVHQTTQIMNSAALAFSNCEPDLVCVFGDTNSSLAFGLAAVKMSLPLAHIEAGCRSHDMTMPEEANRRLIDHCADLLLAVSELGAKNLRKESVKGEIEVVGDPQFDVYSRVLKRKNKEQGRIGLLTLHRPGNVDDLSRLEEILRQLGEISGRLGIRWIFPVHPRTRQSLPESIPPSIQLTDPIPYASLLALLTSASICVTDSGGLQKEALWARVPCVTIRPSTEWMETVWQGANVLANRVSDIAETVIESIETDRSRDFSNPYGNGQASERIVAAIKSWHAERVVSRPRAGYRLR